MSCMTNVGPSWWNNSNQSNYTDIHTTRITFLCSKPQFVSFQLACGLLKFYVVSCLITVKVSILLIETTTWLFHSLASYKYSEIHPLKNSFHRKCRIINQLSLPPSVRVSLKSLPLPLSPSPSPDGDRVGCAGVSVVTRRWWLRTVSWTTAPELRARTTRRPTWRPTPGGSDRDRHTPRTSSVSGLCDPWAQVLTTLSGPVSVYKRHSRPLFSFKMAGGGLKTCSKCLSYISRNVVFIIILIILGSCISLLIIVLNYFNWLSFTDVWF